MNDKVLEREVANQLIVAMGRNNIFLDLISITDNSRRVYYDEPGTDFALKTPKELADEIRERNHYLLRHIFRKIKRYKRSSAYKNPESLRVRQLPWKRSDR